MTTQQEPDFTLLQDHEPIPWDLLLMADPSKEMVERYLLFSEVYVYKDKGQVEGVLVLLPLKDKVEIKNVAVTPAKQGKGIGTFMIRMAMRMASLRGFKIMVIGTANSSIRQLALYQKIGFEVDEVRKDFFLDHYPDPVYEEGVQATDLVILKMEV